MREAAEKRTSTTKGATTGGLEGWEVDTGHLDGVQVQRDQGEGSSAGEKAASPPSLAFFLLGGHSR